MKLLLFLSLLLFPLFFFSQPASASSAHCSPNAISQATVYTNVQTEGDTFISFSYDIDSLCYPVSADKEVNFALVTTTDLYGTNTLDDKDAIPPNVATDDTNTVGTPSGNNWMSASFIGTEAGNWSSFFFDLRLARVGNPGILEILLTTTKGGVGADRFEPSDGPVLLSFGSFDANRLTLAPMVVDSPTYRIHFDSGPTLAAGTDNYALILRVPNGDAGNHVIWRVETGTANVGASSADAGVNWAFIAGGVTPHIAWFGQTFATGSAQFGVADILVNYEPADFVPGEVTGGLYWPDDITPTSGHDLAIPDFKLIILNTTDSPTEPDAVYRLDDACQILRTETLPAGFKLGSLVGFGDQSPTAAEGIPFLEVIMGEGGSLADNLGIDATAAFLILGVFFSLLLMVLTSRFIKEPIFILLAGTLPLIILTMTNFLPTLVLMTVGLFVLLYIVWRTMVKSDV